MQELRKIWDLQEPLWLSSKNHFWKNALNVPFQLCSITKCILKTEACTIHQVCSPFLFVCTPCAGLKELDWKQWRLAIKPKLICCTTKLTATAYLLEPLPKKTAAV